MVNQNYKASIVAPTSDAQGYTLAKCSICGKGTKENYKPAAGHNYKASTVTATCAERGYTLHKYSKCDASSLDYYTTVLGHNMVKQGDNSEYTDKADGFYSIVTCRCSMCDKTEEKKSFVRRWDNFDSELIAQHICNYAISKYGCTRDTSLNLGNGSYFACQDTRDHSEADIAAQSY